MTVRQLFVQTEDYNAADDRLMFAALLPVGADGPIGSQAGVRNLADLRLTMTGAQQGTVSRGAAFVPFGRSIYLAVSDEAATVNFGNADPANTRIDLIVIRVYDQEQSGDDHAPAIEVIGGTPSQNPVAPAVPPGALPLWQVTYAAGSTAPTMLDRRVVAAAPTRKPAAVMRTGAQTLILGWRVLDGWSAIATYGDATVTGAGFVVPRAGTYAVSVLVNFAGQGGGARSAGATHNAIGDSSIATNQQQAPTVGFGVPVPATLWPCQPGDIIAAQGWTNTAGSSVASAWVHAWLID